MKLATIRKAGRYVLSSVVLVFVLGTLASAAEFKADIVQKVGGDTIYQKLFVKNDMERNEISAPTGKQLIIVRFDKRVVWVLNQTNKTYAETPISPKVRMGSLWPQLAKFNKSVKKVGTETVKGYVCDKYRLNGAIKTLDGKSSSANGMSWVSQKLNRDMKADMSTNAVKVIVEVQSVKEGKQPDSLFEIPKGYKKASVPAAPPATPKHK